MVSARVKGAWEAAKQVALDGASNLIQATHRQELTLRRGESVSVSIATAFDGELEDAIFAVYRPDDDVGEELITKSMGAGVERIPGGFKVIVGTSDTDDFPYGPGWAWRFTVKTTDLDADEIELTDAAEVVYRALSSNDFTDVMAGTVQEGWTVERESNGATATVSSVSFPWIFTDHTLKTPGSNRLGTVTLRPTLRSVVAGGPWVCRGE